MTDFSLMNLDMVEQDLQNLKLPIKGAVKGAGWALGNYSDLKAAGKDAWKHRPRRLQNLDTDAYLMNLDNNPANEPWRNGMTDAQLMNLITLEGALDLVGKAKGAGLFNLEQDLELQNLIKLGGVGKLAGKAGKAYLTKGLFQNLDQEQPDKLQNLGWG